MPNSWSEILQSPKSGQKSGESANWSPRNLSTVPSNVLWVNLWTGQLQKQLHTQQMTRLPSIRPEKPFSSARRGMQAERRRL